MIDTEGVARTYSQMRHDEQPWWWRCPCTISVEAGEPIRPGDLVYLSGYGKAYKCVAVKSDTQLTLDRPIRQPWYRRLWAWLCRTTVRVRVRWNSPWSGEIGSTRSWAAKAWRVSFPGRDLWPVNVYGVRILGLTVSLNWARRQDTYAEFVRRINRSVAHTLRITPIWRLWYSVRRFALRVPRGKRT